MTVQKTYKFDPVKDIIGQGGFGTVYRAIDDNLGIEVAIKKYKGNLPKQYSLFEEIKRVIGLNHPNLVRYYDAFALHETSAFADTIQVGVMEYVNGGDLFALLRTKPQTEVLKGIFANVMNGLAYLHSQGIIHRDLKPENILLQHQGERIIPKIADFGISKALFDPTANQAASIIIGSVEYMAPEQFNLSKYGKQQKLHTNLDLWSLGTMMYEAFTGEAPFGKTQKGFSRDEVMRNILDKKLDFSSLPAPFDQIVARCLVRHAAERAQSVDELLALLNPANPASNNTSAPIQRSVTDTFSTSVLELPPHISSPIAATSPRNVSSSYNAAPKPANITPPHTEPAAASTSNWATIGLLFPILTLVAMYGIFNSKISIFGPNVVSGGYTIVIFIIGLALIAANSIWLLVGRKSVLSVPVYLFSTLGIGYYSGQSGLLYRLGRLSGFTFDISQHSFTQTYPYIWMAVTILALIWVLWKQRSAHQTT